MKIRSWDKYLRTYIAFAIVISNIILGHFLPPSGLLISPLVVVAAVVLIRFNKERFTPIWQAILAFLLIALNDVGIKIYGGGIHDSQGQGVMFLMLLIGIVPCFFILLSSIINTSSTPVKKTIAVFTFIILLILHIYFFGVLGLNPSYI